MRPFASRWVASLALTGLLGFTPLLRAADQPASTPPARGQRGPAVAERLKAVAQELNLSDEQRSKMETLLKKEAEKVRALRQDTSLAPEQRREKLRAVRTELVPEVKKILTAEQFAKWEKMRAERRNRAGQGGAPGGGPPRRGQGQGGNAQ